MYLIYNNDGSLKLKVFTDYIMQGSNNANIIFVSISGRSTDSYTCDASFVLPDGITTYTLAGVYTNFILDGTTYSGYQIALGSDETAQAGALQMSIRLYSAPSVILYTYSRNLTVNASAIDANAPISIAEYQSYLAQLAAYQLSFSPTNVRGYSTLALANADLNNLGANQIVVVGSETIFTVYQKQGTALVALTHDDLFKIEGSETLTTLTITTSATSIINAYNAGKVLLLSLTNGTNTSSYLLDGEQVSGVLSLTGYSEGYQLPTNFGYHQYLININLTTLAITATKTLETILVANPKDYNGTNDLLGGISFGQERAWRLATKTSDLTNDSNYQNNTQVSATITAALNGYATQNWVGEQGYAKSTDLNNYILTSQKGIANGIASLDSSGLIPSNQLPSYVDDIIEGYYYQNQFYNDSEHTSLITPETGKIYVDLATNQQYRWGGTEYHEISSGAIGGVKGNAETTYRTGLVNLTPANIGSPTIADLTSETNTRIANEGKLYSLDFNGALSGTTITFTPTNTLPTLIDNALYEIDLHLSLTSVLLDTYNIILSINGTNVLINSILNGSTVGGLRQVEKYSNDTGYRWNFVAIYNLVNSVGYLTIPTSVNQESITRMSDENLLTAITNSVGIADKQVILISSVGNGNGYLLGHYYLISYNYSTNTYTTSDITPTYSYTLPIASASTLGGIKVGNNLSIDSNGVLSASGGASVSQATTSVAGINTLGSATLLESHTAAPSQALTYAMSSATYYDLTFAGTSASLTITSFVYDTSKNTYKNEWAWGVLIALAGAYTFTMPSAYTKFVYDKNDTTITTSSKVITITTTRASQRYEFVMSGNVIYILGAN